jgi:hypothetical protein
MHDAEAEARASRVGYVRAESPRAESESGTSPHHNKTNKGAAKRTLIDSPPCPRRRTQTTVHVHFHEACELTKWRCDNSRNVRAEKVGEGHAARDHGMRVCYDVRWLALQ